MSERSLWQALPGAAERPSSLDGSFRAHARSKPDAVAIITPERSWTWREVDEAADALAAVLRDRGLAPGDRVGWLGRNRAEFAVVLLAARRARLILAGLNWRLAPRELEEIITCADPALIISDPEFVAMVPAGRKIIATRNVEGHPDLAELLADARPAGPLQPQPADACTLFFTSGTSGLPKGVLYPLESAEAAVLAPSTLEFTPDSILLIVAPMFHMAGWMWCQYGLAGGLQQVLLPDAAPASMLAAIERWAVTHVQWVPTMIAAAVEQQLAELHEVGSLEIVAYGASPIAPSLLAQAQSTFKCRFTQVYGLTETVGPVTHLPSDAHRPPWEDATGFVNPGLEVRIVGPDGAAVAPGATGEILIRTPWPKAQYWRLSDPARNGFDPEGWLHTGDAGFMDETGCLHVTDRLNDMIITGGENVFPAEVEKVLTGLRGVADAAVFGAPDPRWGEVVWAAIVPSAEPQSDEDLVQGCRERLSHYKCPRRIVRVEQLARNATGKILRREIRHACLAKTAPAPA
jgi:acyl-CoA synthetase (AMP-forming)/AMP-acid ligase II